MGSWDELKGAFQKPMPELLYIQETMATLRHLAFIERSQQLRRELGEDVARCLAEEHTAAGAPTSKQTRQLRRRRQTSSKTTRTMATDLLPPA